MSCSSNCKTQDHATWGECIRAKGIRTQALNVDTSARQKEADRNLDNYRAARRAGIQPKSTQPKDVAAAVRASEKVGHAYDATSQSFKK